MKKIIVVSIKLLISSCASLIFLSLFCYIYNYTGVHIDNNEGFTDYKWESNQYFSTMKEGFSWFRFDNNGFNNSYYNDINDNEVDILVMGSSNVEGVNVSPKDNMVYILNKELQNKKAYNIGISGHFIYTVVHNMDAAVNKYNNASIIVFELGETKLDVNKMNDVLTNKYIKLKSYDSGLMYFLQKKIPFIKSLYKSLDEWYSNSKKQLGFNEDKNYNNEKVENYNIVLDSFFKYARNQVPAEKELIIFFHPETKIDEYGRIIKHNEEELMMIKDACEKNNIVFVDCSDDFYNLYNNQKILAHGFNNGSLGSGHLNKFGHKIVAENIARYINNEVNN